MKIEEARIAIIQDDNEFVELEREFLAKAKFLTIEETLEAGLALISDLSKGRTIVDLLALDENLHTGVFSGEDGMQLYEQCVSLGLPEIVRIVSISDSPNLPIPRIGAHPGNLVEYIQAL